MKAGAEQAAFVFRLVGIKAAALPDIERIGKYRAEFRERRLVAGPLSGGHDEIGVLHARRVGADLCLERGQIFAVGTEADETVADDLSIAAKREHRLDGRRTSLDAQRGAIEIAAMGRVHPVFPVHERLRADAQALHRRAGEDQSRVPAHADDEFAHAVRTVADEVALIGFRHRQRAPHRLQLCERPDIFLRLERAPDRRQILCAALGHLHLGGDVGERGARFTEHRPMLVDPRGPEVIGVIGVLTIVEIDDLLDAVLIPIGLDEHLIRCERESVRVEEHVIRYAPRRLQVLGQERRRHRQRLAGVVEPRLVGGIDGKLARRTHVDAGQIADRVVVFRIAQPACEDNARIAVVFARLGRPRRLDPVDDLLPRLIGWLIG